MRGDADARLPGEEAAREIESTYRTLPICDGCFELV
jgi:hypothetical protein